MRVRRSDGRDDEMGYGRRHHPNRALAGAALISFPPKFCHVAPPPGHSTGIRVARPTRIRLGGGRSAWRRKVRVACICICCPSPSELFRVRPSSFESVRIHPSRPQTQAHWSGPARRVAGGWPGLDGLDGLRAAAVPGKQAIPVTIRPADPRRQQSQ